MIPQLMIVIVLPIIMTIVSVSPFEPPEIEEENIPQTEIDESSDSTRQIIIIMLAIVWMFFLARMLRVLFIVRSKSRLRK